MTKKSTLSGYQAGGTPAMALVGDYCSERDRRLAYWYRRYDAARRGQAEKARAAKMIRRLGGEI